jgi:hypothetical protein
MPAVSTRALGRAVLLLAALSAGGLPACGDKTPQGPAETWPLTVSEPAVLGYAAVSLPRAELTSLLRSLLGWVPEGLADDRPFVALRLDSTTCGGPLAVMAPLADGRAFDASLKNNPLVQVTGEGRYRVRLPPESGLGMLLLLSSAGGMSSPTDILAALQRGIETDFPLQIEQRDGIAFAAPSFEALSLCRSLHERLDGPPPADVVLTVDLARVQTVYAEEIRRARDQFRALISGARVSAPLLMGMQMEGGLDLPINWELLWALLEMFEARQFAAAQLWLTLQPPGAGASAAEAGGPPGETAVEDPGAVLDRLTQVSLRLRLDESSPLRAVVDSLRPAPALEGAWLEAAADPAAFAQAFAQWSRPVSAVVKGEGPPCDRYVDELAALLGGWNGHLALVSDAQDLPVLLLSTREGGATLERWQAWLTPLLATAHVESLPSDARLERLEDGTLVVRDALGEVVLRGRLDEGVFWVASGEGAVPGPSLLQPFRESRSPASGAALHARYDGHAVQLANRNGELWLQFTVHDDGR